MIVYAWTLRIGDKAYANVVPVAINVIPEVVRVKTNSWLFFNTVTLDYTGRWVLLFTYNRGPNTFNRTDAIPFSSEKEARQWFDHIFNTIFIELTEDLSPPPAEKTTKVSKITNKNKKNHLRLI